MGPGLNSFLEEHSPTFAFVLGILVFYNFTPATNEAVKSLLWLFSSIIVIVLMTYLFFRAFFPNTSVGTKFAIGLPLFLIDFVFTNQVILSLFEPENSASLRVMTSFFTKEFLIYSLLSLMLIALISLLILILRKKGK